MSSFWLSLVTLTVTSLPAALKDLESLLSCGSESCGSTIPTRTPSFMTSGMKAAKSALCSPPCSALTSTGFSPSASVQ